MELLEFNVPFASRGYQVVARSPLLMTYQRRETSLVAVAAEGRLNAPVERIHAVLVDYGRHASFVKGVAESRVLWKGSSEAIVYQRLDLPLISDRDYTLAVKWWRRDGQLYLRFDCANQRGPAPRPGTVRVQTHSGGWILRPALVSSTLARYQVEIDLGGSLPSWMARSGTAREIPLLFQTIARQASLLNVR